MLEEGDPARFQSMMNPFRAMVDLQLGFASRVSDPRWRRSRHKPKSAASRMPLISTWLLEPRLLCLIGEANAWPHDRALGGPPHPHELVYCCAAVLGDDRRFEQLIAPRLPLSDSPIRHARLTEDELAHGSPVAFARAAWDRFVRPDDVICVWGHHTLGLLQREDMTLPGRVLDIRRVAGDHLKSRPGSAEELVERLGLTWHSQGRGRGGERLGMLIAITRWLAEAARQGTTPADLGTDRSRSVLPDG
jgi:hypothetical protein